MKLTKEELLKKVSEIVNDEEVSIELMEDISDSMELVDTSTDSIELETTRNKLEEMTMKYSELQKRFKERFLEGVEEPKEIVEEEKYIDVKEI